MARNVFKVETTGNKKILQELGRIAEEFPVFTREALAAQEKVVEDKIRQNWVSIAGGNVGDYIYDSVGKSVRTGSNGTDAVGTVGVYNIDNVAAAHGRFIEEGKRKPMNAAQIAYWVEFGTSRLRSGARKKPGVEYNPADLITNSPKPFISNAYFSSISEQEVAFAEKFNQLMDRMLK